MRTAALLLLLLAAATGHNHTDIAPDDSSSDNAHSVDNDRLLLANDTSFNANDTLTDELDGEHEPVVRKKRTFGDIVFRGLADVLGYNVARKPPQAAFPPPLAPVPGIDTPIQAAPAPAPAPAPAVAPPCGAPRAAAPPPCAAQRPPAPKPRAAPPCPRPRAAARPKPKPTPPPPPPPPPPLPPCARPRANPTTPSPCAPAPPPPPPPKQQADPNLETISSNFQLNFNFNRKPATPAPATADAEEQVEAEAEQEQVVPIAPIAIEPRAAKLPPSEPRKPRVYVDAFVVRNGVAQKVDAVDANHFDPQRAADEDYLAYDEEADQVQYDDYEDAQESRDREKAVQEFGTAVDQFWQKKKQQRIPQPQRLPPQKLPTNHYKNVHFGDRDLASQVRLQSLQRERPHPNRIPLPLPEAEDDDAEATTTTEDPKRPLRPRVLPPTEHNPNQIDTVTVRVPPIYKEKRPKKHRERPVERDRDSTETDDVPEFETRREEHDSDTEVDDSWQTPRTERPVKRKRRRKQNRKARSVEDSEEYSAGDYDYYGKKLPVSQEEKYYMQLTVPTPTKYPELERLEAPQSEHFLDDHERLKEDPERADDGERSDDKGRADDSGRADDTGRADDSGRADERERSVQDTERANDKGRADERERTDKLSPNAQVHESGYQNNYVHATNVQVDNPHPAVATVKRKTVKIGKP